MEKDAAGCRALNRNYYCRRQYSGRDVSDADLLGGLIKEKIVLQYFEKTGEQISDEEVESQYELLKTVE